MSSFYRPQTKLWEGNVFTPVCDSVHGGVSLSRVSLCPGWVSVQGALYPWGLCPGGSLSRGVSVQGVSVQGVSVQGGLCPGGLCPGGSLSWGICQGDPRTVKSRQYASYWNAFLFFIFPEGKTRLIARIYESETLFQSAVYTPPYRDYLPLKTGQIFKAITMHM